MAFAPGLSLRSYFVLENGKPPVKKKKNLTGTRLQNAKAETAARRGCPVSSSDNVAAEFKRAQSRRACCVRFPTTAGEPSDPASKPGMCGDPAVALST